MTGPQRLLPPANNGISPVAPVTYGIYGGVLRAEPGQDEVWGRVAYYFGILKRQSWKIVALVTLTMTATAVVSSRLTPIYESATTIDLDRHVPAGVLGQEAMQYPGADADQFLATQLKLIQSDSVLRPVVDRFQLPVHEAAGNSGSEWAKAANAPVELKDLRVVRLPNTYLLQIRYRSPDPQLAADVANAIANSYVLHSYTVRYDSTTNLAGFLEKQLEELKAKMQHSSIMLAQFERELNMINPEEKTSILSSRLLQLNTEYTNAQADRVKKEAAFNAVKGGSLEAAQVSTQGEVLRKLGERLGESEEKFAQVKAHYGVNHPEYRRAAAQVAQVQTELTSARRSIAGAVESEYLQALDREGMLKVSVAENKAELDRLNARSFQYQTVKRDADADKKLYEELTRKIKEAGINAAFQNTAIRLADAARPALKPIFPKTTLNLALAFLISGLFGIGAAVLADAFDHSLRDARQASRVLNLDVIGTLPVVKPWRRLRGGAAKERASLSVLPGGNSPAVVPFSEAQIAAGFDDAIRMLLNSILLGSPDRPLKSILISSAFPREGKTTVATHLAMAHAQQKHKTLLIDGDLRRCGVSGAMRISNDAGLSKALRNGFEWRKELSKTQGLAELDILCAGPDAASSADAAGKFIADVVREAGGEYDLVIVDAPPMLGFAEPLRMAAAVDGVVVVARAGQTHRQALDSLLSMLARIRANVVGLVLNEVNYKAADAYQCYGYSQPRQDGTQQRYPA